MVFPRTEILKLDKKVKKVYLGKPLGTSVGIPVFKSCVLQLGVLITSYRGMEASRVGIL